MLQPVGRAYPDRIGSFWERSFRVVGDIPGNEHLVVGSAYPVLNELVHRELLVIGRGIMMEDGVGNRLARLRRVRIGPDGITVSVIISSESASYLFRSSFWSSLVPKNGPFYLLLCSLTWTG